jgi:excisionase family DNA binding protein
MAVKNAPEGKRTVPVPAVLLPLGLAAQYLTLSDRTLNALRARGEIRAVQVSARRIAFRVADLDAYIDARLR